MRKTLLTLTLLAAVAASLVPVHLTAQGYSGALPNVSKTSATGLGLTYTAGTITYGGATQAITANTLTATDSMTDCSAPDYASCNFVYWASSTSLSITTNKLTAFKPGQVVVAFVTATGGNISAVRPVSWNPAQPVLTYTDETFTVVPSACASGFTTTAADTGFPTFLSPAAGQVNYAVQTDTTGGTVTVNCVLTLPTTRTTSGGGGVFTLTGVNVLYSVVTTTLTSIANPTVKINTGPAAGGTAAGTIADALGTLTFSPSTIQKTAITAGTYYTLNITGDTPLALTSAVRTLSIGFSMVTAGTTKTRFDLNGFVLLGKRASY